MPAKAHWSVFLPALVVYPLWITIGLREGLFPSLATYWPVGAAMVIGSMIAGSTPLGGGIVAFPVTLLVLGFSSSQGRDASLLIQSVGMTAASYLILYKKRGLVSGCEDLICKFIVMSTVGLVIGFEMLGSLSPLIVEIVYATLVVCVVFVFMYGDFIEAGMKSDLHKTKSAATLENSSSEGSPGDSAADPESDKGGGDAPSGLDGSRRRPAARQRHSLPTKLVPSALDESSTPQDRVPADEEAEGLVHREPGRNGATAASDARAASILQDMCLCVFAVTGGMLSSLIGSGADVACYLYGSFVYCKFGPTRNQIPDNSLTAASVIVMASMSVFGSILRVTSRNMEPEVFRAWFASAQVVVLGAPVGSLFLTPRNQRRLKMGFYVLGVLQLVLFGVMKIGGDAIAWVAVAGCIIAVLGALLVHYMVYRRAEAAHELD